MGPAWESAPYANPSANDTQYVHDALAAVAALYTVDAARVYASGKSNGGGFAALLASRPDATAGLFAAVAVASPALYVASVPARPTPLLHVHGRKDAVTPFEGRPEGEEGWGALPDVRVWRRRWAERNGAGRDAAPEEAREVHPGVWEEVWYCGRQDGALEVRALSVDGLGHAWPTTEGLDASGRPDNRAVFNFTEQHLVGFFSRHALG